jgi:hypothetical protein
VLDSVTGQHLSYKREHVHVLEDEDEHEGEHGLEHEHEHDPGSFRGLRGLARNVRQIGPDSCLGEDPNRRPPMPGSIPRVRDLSSFAELLAYLDLVGVPYCADADAHEVTLRARFAPALRLRWEPMLALVQIIQPVTSDLAPAELLRALAQVPRFARGFLLEGDRLTYRALLERDPDGRVATADLVRAILAAVEASTAFLRALRASVVPHRRAA